MVCLTTLSAIHTTLYSFE